MTVRVCLVGTGDFAYVHADCWQRVPGAELVAVAGRTPDRVARLLRNRPGIRPMTIDEALNPQNPYDLVDIVTPHALHAGQAVRALLAKYHVLVEKPMATSTKDAETMVRTAAESGRRCFVVSQYRFIPAFRVLFGTLRRYPVKRVRYSMKATLVMAGINTAGTESWKAKRALSGGGILIGSLVHPLDLFLKWFGEPLDIKSEIGCDLRGIDVETRVHASWKTPAGVHVELEGQASPGAVPSAILEIESASGRIIRVKDRRIDAGTAPLGWKLRELWTGLRGRIVPWRREPLARQFADIVNAITLNVPAEVEGADGLAVIRAVDRIYQAANPPAGG